LLPNLLGCHLTPGGHLRGLSRWPDKLDVFASYVQFVIRHYVKVYFRENVIHPPHTQKTVCKITALDFGTDKIAVSGVKCAISKEINDRRCHLGLSIGTQWFTTNVERFKKNIDVKYMPLFL
jgi:hypothetical protein